MWSATRRKSASAMALHVVDVERGRGTGYA
jgi:hypothetical protein